MDVKEKIINALSQVLKPEFIRLEDGDGVTGFIVLAFFSKDVWLAAIAVFMLMNCWGGLKQAQALLRMAKLPRRQGFSCPTCNTAPPAGPYWKCGRCGQPFDTFATGAVCPNCHAQSPATQCLDCGRQHPLPEWAGQTLVATGH